MDPNNRLNYNFVSLQKVTIKDLEPNINNVLVVAIIIGKMRPKIFEATQKNDVGTGPRAVWNLTIRDSVQHYVNVNYWGSPEQVFQANDKFSTGDVVEIVNPQVIIRRMDDRSEQFQPMVTSPYKLSLTEKSAIVPHPNKDLFQELLHFPTKPTAVYLPIQDIHNRGGSIEYADVLGAVRGLNQVRSLQTKSNEMSQVREIEVFDHTSHSLKISLWEPDLINRSNSWKPRTTILFLTDLKICWSNYAHTYVASTSSRTIVTQDPVSKEAKALFHYAQTAPIETFDIVEQLVTALPDSSVIDEIMTVNQLHGRVNKCVENKQTVNFTVTMFAFITALDLDGFSRILIVKCGHCKTAIKGFKCENSDCPVVFDNQSISPEITFDIRVKLTDHTGTLINCKLSGHTAEAALGCSAQQFSKMSDDQKCHLKWETYLLEQCKVRIAVIFMISQNPIFSILNVERADPCEVATKLPMY